MTNGHFDEVQRRVRRCCTVAKNYGVTFSFNGWGIAVREEENRFRVSNGGELCPLAPILLLKRYATGLPSLEEELAVELGVSLEWVDGFFDYRQLGQELDNWLGDFLGPDDADLSDYQRGALAAADVVEHILWQLRLDHTPEQRRGLMREEEWRICSEPFWVIRKVDDGQSFYKCRDLADPVGAWLPDVSKATRLSGRAYADEIAALLTQKGYKVRVEEAPPW